jgi:uncharacterized damage-inducible protein DinB
VKEEKMEKDRLVKEFSDGIDHLDEVLKDLSETDIDLSRSEGKWTIRQIVHHISEAEVLWNTALKAALANPGCTFDFNWYIADNKCADSLLYHRRPIKEALALFRSSRKQVLELINLIDNAWEQFLYPEHQSMPEKRKFSVNDIIQWQIKHLGIHINQIRETRKVHKKMNE